MDPMKKRKLEENGFNDSDPLKLSPSEARKLIERFTPDQLLEILQNAVVRHPDVLAAVRAASDPDVSQRKLFIRGLGWDTTTDGLRSLFSTYGDLEEAVVILDKATGKSKGYGFVTFRHVDGALLALREPSKRIDGRVTVTQLAAAGNTASNANAADVALRKIYVANVPPDLPADKLLAHFSVYGEIEEGPLGFDKQTGKSKGFALFVYKTPEGAQAALLDPVKAVEGRQLSCKLAITDGKQGKRPGPDGPQAHGNVPHGHGDGVGAGMGMGMGMPPAAGSGPGQYGGPVGLGSYGSGYGGQPPLGNHPLNSSNPVPGSMAGAAGYGAGMGGPYGGYGGPGSTGYGGAGGLGGGNGVGVAGGAGGLGGSATGSLYRLPGSAGMPAGAGGYPDGGHYGLSASTGYQNQHHPPSGASPVPRVPPGSMYPNVYHRLLGSDALCASGDCVNCRLCTLV
ncbi:UBP1-associated protein 2C, partial [Mucuna pruriens]